MAGTQKSTSQDADVTYHDVNLEKPGPPRDTDNDSITDAARGDNLPDGYFTSWQFIGSIAGFSCGVMSAYVIFVMSTSVLSFTNADIGPSANISWIQIARTLGQSLMFLIQGRLSDLFGRRWFFLGGNIVALISVIVCAVAPNINTMIGMSIIYGMGECVQMSFGVALGELVPNKWRPMIMSLVFACCSPFAIFGPKIARRFIDVGMGWRWNYYLGTIVIALGTVLLFFCYHPPTFHMLHEKKSKKTQLKELDYVGMILWAIGLTLFLLGISWGGGFYPWNHPATISCLVLGAVTLIAFGCWEAYADLKYPVMPMYYFKNRGYISLVVCAVVASMFYYSAILLWPQQISLMITSDTDRAGWIACTVPASVQGGQVLAGLIIKYVPNTRWLMIGANIAMVAFLTSMASLNAGDYAKGIAFTVMGPFLVGFIELAAMSLSPLFCKPEEIGTASGMLAAIRAAGGSVAVAIYTTILTNRLTTTVADTVGHAAVEAGMSSSNVGALVAAVKSSVWQSLPFLTRDISAAIAANIPRAYAQAFQTVYLSSLAFGGITIVAGIMTIDATPLLTNKVERRMHGKGIDRGAEAKVRDAKHIEEA